MVLIQDHGKNPLPLGSQAPAFEALLGTDGRHYALSDFAKSLATVLVFTCNHCPYAVAYEDRLIELAQRFQSQRVSFIAISANDADNYPQDGYPQMQERARSKNFPFPYLYDESQDVAKAYRAVCTPHVFVIHENKLVYRGRIDDSWRDANAVTQADLANALDALIAGAEIAVAETHPMGCSIKWKWDE